MTIDKRVASIETISGKMPAEYRKLLSELHDMAVNQGCAYRVSPGEAEDTYNIAYSAMDFMIHIDEGGVSFSSEYDIRAFLDFYRNAADSKAKEMLFQAVESCVYCIDDKCTTLLSNRKIALGAKEKKLCGPYRHHLRIPVTTDTLESARSIFDMIFEYCTPAMHTDLFYENEVDFKVEGKPEFYMVGYKHPVNVLSIGVEEFVKDCLTAEDSGARKMDALFHLTGQTDSGSFVGAIDGFITASRYDFIFGITCEKGSIPEQLPEDVVKLKLFPGEYAVYNSSAGDYDSIWRHFTEKFYESTLKGYDAHRIPYEFYDEGGNFSNVHIPVSDEMPKDSGRYTRVVFTPDIKVAGIMTCCEKDHPLYKDDTGIREKLRAYFPHAERIIGTATHAEFGLPMTHIIGVEVDKLDIVPDELEVYTLRGGYWHLSSWRHFSGGGGGHYALEGLPFKAATSIDGANHPRAFIEYQYTGRGGLCETAVPMRKQGERRIELVEKDECLLVGKEEAPPDSTVTEADINVIYNLESSLEKGSFTAAFRYEMHRKLWFFKKPVIKGAEVADFDNVPEGMNTYTLEGGRYVRITETLPNGGYDWWTSGYAFGDMKDETGYEIDLSRLFFVRQTGYGRESELYVPVR